MSLNYCESRINSLNKYGWSESFHFTNIERAVNLRTTVIKIILARSFIDCNRPIEF